MTRKMRQRRASSSITLFTSICMSLTLTWVAIIMSASQSSCVGVHVQTRCFSEVRTRSSFALLLFCPWEVQEVRAQGMTTLDRRDDCPGQKRCSVRVISTKVTNFRVKNTKLKKKCCKEGCFTFSFVPFPAASTVFLLHLCKLQASI